jgi:hypothetical protein
VLAPRINQAEVLARGRSAPRASGRAAPGAARHAAPARDAVARRRNVLNAFVVRCAERIAKRLLWWTTCSATGPPPTLGAVNAGAAVPGASARAVEDRST